jgi:hypothetical protein
MTDQYPDGKLDEHDEGELTIGLATDIEKGVIRIHFGKPVLWIALDPESAKGFAKVITEKAQEIMDKTRADETL